MNITFFRDDYYQKWKLAVTVKIKNNVITAPHANPDHCHRGVQYRSPTATVGFHDGIRSRYFICRKMMMMMSHAEAVIGLVFHPYCRHPSDGGAHHTDGLGQNQLRDYK